MGERNRRIGEKKSRKNGGERPANAAFWTAAFIFASLLGCGNVASADVVAPSRDRIEDCVETKIDVPINVSVGVRGVYKSGVPTRVVASWGGDERSNEPFFALEEIEAIELETIDSDGTPFVVSRKPTFEESAARRVEILGIFPKATGKLTVRVRTLDGRFAEKTLVPTAKKVDAQGQTRRRSQNGADGETVSETENASFDANDVFFPPAPSSKPIYLVVGDDRLGISEAFGELRWRDERRPNVVKVERFSDFPTDFRALEGIERVILTATEPDFFRGVDANDPRIEAIERWTERGGDVVLLAGEKSIPLLAPGGAWSTLSPGDAVAEKLHEFRVVNSLVVELKNVKNLALTGAKAFPFLNVPVLSKLKPNAVVEMREAETPLLVARPVGLGSVVFFAADLSTPPFSNWSGRGKLWLKILGFDADSANAKGASSSFVKRGFNDLSGQLRGSLDVFDGVRVVPFSLVLVAIFVFLLAIGPLDRFLAKKVFKRPSATWATFPIYVVGFCLLVFWTTNATRPKKPILNRAEVVDVDVESGIVRDVFWAGLYSPSERRYDLAIRPGSFRSFAEQSLSLQPTETFASFGPLTLDGTGIGGAEEKSILTRLWDAPYRTSNEETSSISDADAGVGVELFDVPTTARSSKSFAGRWTSRLSNLPASGTLVDDGLTLRGSVVNPFDVPIYSAFVIYSGGAYSLGTLAPGETELGATATRLETRRVLNEHQSSIPTAEANRWDATTYRPESTRIPYILRTLSFYQFAGGEEAFGVAKRLQGDVDLSDSLRCGRAVLFGTIVDSEAERYRSSDLVERNAADALELARLNRQIAERQGGETKSASELAFEQYGDFGSSDAFEPTAFALKSADDTANDAALDVEGKRTVVVRLIVPLTRGAAPNSSSN